MIFQNVDDLVALVNGKKMEFVQSKAVPKMLEVALWS